MSVTPRFFATMEIPLTHGRDFSDRDVSGAPNVAILNETAARTLFPGASPVGNRFGFSPEQNRDVEVVGVIRDTKYSSVRDAAPPTVYQPFLQGTPRGMTAVLRTAVDPNSLVDEVRATVRQVDTNLPLTNVTTQSRQVEQRFAQERLFANAYTLFGALALTLACIGLFGLMSYGVSRRTNEIGIRLALGAGRPRVIRMVLGESLVLVGAGIGVGLAAAFAAGRFVASVLFGLAPTDPATMAVTIVLIVAVGVLAAYAPARRAARVDPMVALRAD
jgi:predicted permease